MEWIKYVFVAVILLRSIYTDVKRGIIENKCVGAGFVTGCCWRILESGMQGFLESAKTALIMFCILFVFYIVKGLGAGDIKLFCVLAVFFPDEIFKMVAMAFLTAAVFAITQMIIRWIKKRPVYQKGETMIFSVPIGIGVVIGLCWQELR